MNLKIVLAIFRKCGHFDFVYWFSFPTKWSIYFLASKMTQPNISFQFLFTVLSFLEKVNKKNNELKKVVKLRSIYSRFHVRITTSFVALISTTPNNQIQIPAKKQK